MLLRTVAKALLAGVLAGAIAGAASANLILIGTTTTFGSGIGAVPTLLTVQDNGVPGTGNGNGIESGCVGAGAGGTTVIGSTACLFGLQGADEGTGANQTQLQPATASGATDAGQLSLIVNVSEPGNDSTATLTSLYLALYNSTTGAQLGSFPYIGPAVTLIQVGSGVGVAGYVFRLDDAQAATAGGLCPNLSLCTVGAGAQFAAGTTAGTPETVLLAAFPRAIAVPEPGTLALISISLIGLAGLRRKLR